MADPFISRQDLSDYIGRDVSGDDGATIAINAACDIVRTVAEQMFTPVTETIALDGTGTDCVLLPERPVNAVGTVVVNGTAKGSLDYVSTTDGKLFATDGTANFTTWATGWTWIRGGTACWPLGRQNVVVTYDHGYASGTAADIPDDVRMVALALASRLVIQGVAVFEAVGSDSIRYAGPATDLTNGEQMILRKYRTV